jgi:SAM-dependent methyltransferase
MRCESDAARLGLPSYAWRFGQDRRMSLIARYAPLEGKRILDAGCGVGMYVRHFQQLSQTVYGVELEESRAAEAAQASAGIACASVEALPFPSDTFDVVLSHEVLEHVADDRRAAEEAVRVLRPGGRLVVFVPNRWWLFETHGVYWRGRYHFGNIPLVGYLPARLRDCLAPHVRAYTWGSLRALFADMPCRVIVHTAIFPGYDKLVARNRSVGEALRRVTYLLERTPLRWGGLSHFLVLEKWQVS